MNQDSCANCNRKSPIRIYMKPGRDGQEFWICTWCYEGVGHNRPLPAAYSKKKGTRR